VCPQPGHEEVKRRQRERKRDICGVSFEVEVLVGVWRCGGEKVTRGGRR